MDYNCKVVTGLNDNGYHDVTRHKIRSLMDDLPLGVARVLQFESPTGTGKTRMVMHRDSTANDKVLLLVPTVVLCNQVSSDYGIKAINGTVDELHISRDDSAIVSTYDGLKRFLSEVTDISKWSLYVDESHKLVEASGYRGGAIGYLALKHLGFYEVVLMSATHRDNGPICPNAFYIVRGEYQTIPMFSTQCEDYLQMAKVELKGTNTVYLVVNNKKEITALARVAISEGLTVGIMTSDLKETEEFKSILSGKFRPQIILCTCIIYDGINIDPSNHVIIITRHTKIIASELVQLSSRNRASGKKMIKPSKVIICSEETSLERGMKVQELDEKLAEVQQYCDIIKSLYAYLRGIGKLDESINNVMDINYSHMISIDYDTLEVTPNIAHCIGSVEDERRDKMTLGDFVHDCAVYNIIYIGNLDYDESESLEKVKEASKSVKKDVKLLIQDCIAGFSEACNDGTISLYIDEYLKPENAHNHSKDEISAVSSLASARRRLIKVDGYSDSMFGDLTEGVDTKSKAADFKRKVTRHESLALALSGQGRFRDDVATIVTMWDNFKVGDEFTSDELATDYALYSSGAISGFSLPKNPVTLIRQMFDIKRFKMPKGDDGKRKNAYRIEGKKLIHDRVKELQA